MMDRPRVETLMVRALAVARQARDHGNHPFGALLADSDGVILFEAENTVATDGDCTGHAELNLVRRACRSPDRVLLAASTLVTSTEPCAMCAGAIYWADIRRVVFGLREGELRTLVGSDARNPTMALPCREVFARGSHRTEVVGPVLEDEARAVHSGFWV